MSGPSVEGVEIDPDRSLMLGGTGKQPFQAVSQGLSEGRPGVFGAGSWEGRACQSVEPGKDGRVRTRLLDGVASVDCLQ